MRRYHKNSNGFTMAEMLITVAIIVILCGFGFVAVIAHQRNLKRMEMDETAQEIFIAAQNHLTAAEANGQWDAFLKKTSGTNSEAARGVELANGPAGYDKTSDKDAASRKFYSFTTESDEAVQKGAVSLILPEGSIDETLRGHHFYVEYDAASGTVYGVFYTDADHEITADDAEKVSRTDPNARRDYKDANGKRTIIGYYGGALGELKSSEDLYAPAVAVRNAESLVLYVVDKNYHRPASSETSTGDSTQTSDENAFKTTLQLTFEGETSGAKTVKTIDPETIDSQADSFSKSVLTSDSTKDFQVVVPGREQNGSQKTVNKKAKYYAIVLDSIVRGNGHFADLFQADDTDASKKFIPGEDIRITVTLHSNKGGEDVSQTVRVNSLFNSVKKEKNAFGMENGKAVVTVSNPRHLENLSTEVSGVDFVSKKIVKDTAVDTVSIVRNLFWDEDAVAEAKAKEENEKETVTAFLPAIASATGMESPFGYCADGTKAITKDAIQVYQYKAGSDAGDAAAEIAKGACYGITNTAIQNFEGNNHMLAAFRFEGEQESALINRAAAAIKVSDLVIADSTSCVTGEIQTGSDPAVEVPTAAMLIAKANSGYAGNDNNNSASVENVQIVWYRNGANQDGITTGNSKATTEPAATGTMVYSGNGIASLLIGSVDANNRLPEEEGKTSQQGTPTNKFTIKNVTIQAGDFGRKKTANVGVEGNVTAGLIGEIKSGAVTIGNSDDQTDNWKTNIKIHGTLTLNAVKGEKSAAGGLVGKVADTASIQNDALTLQKVYLEADTLKMNGRKNQNSILGGFIGSVEGGKSVHIENADLIAKSVNGGMEEKSQEWNADTTGGTIGSVTAGTKTELKDVRLTTAEGKLGGKQASGGVVGSLASGEASLESVNVRAVNKNEAEGQGQSAVKTFRDIEVALSDNASLTINADNGSDSAAGGLIGNVSGQVSKLNITKSSVKTVTADDKNADLTVTGANIGGLIGVCGAATSTIGGDGDNEVILTVQGNFSLAQSTQEAKNAGGLIGKIGQTGNAGNAVTANVQNVPLTARTMHAYAAGDNNGNGTVGGFVGYVATGSSSVSLSSCNLSANSIDLGERETNNSTNTVKAAGGAVGKISAGTVTLSNLTVLTPKASQDAGEGANDNYIRVIADRGTAGGLVGVAESGTTRLEISNAAVSGSGVNDQIEAGGSAGGLVGDSKAGQMSITNSMASMYVQTDGITNVTDSSTGAGGLVGSAAGTVTIQNSYSGGRTTGGKYADNATGQGRYNVYLQSSTGAAGGILGKMASGSLEVKNSYSTSSVAVPKTNATGNGADVGGFVGYANGLNAENTYCTGRVYVTGNGSAGSGVTPHYGTYAGKLTSLSGQENHYLKGIKGATDNAVGTLGNTSDIDSVKTKINGKLTEADYADNNSPLRNNVPSDQKTYCYDTALQGKAYPLKSATTASARTLYDPNTGDKVTGESADGNQYAQIGDWEVPEKSSETEFGPYALIYYERIWNPETKSLDPTFYYHGYALPNGEKGTDESVKYKEISTKEDSLPDDMSWNEHHLVTSKEEYVVEDGYLLLIDKNVFNDAGGENGWRIELKASGDLNNDQIRGIKNTGWNTDLVTLGKYNGDLSSCQELAGYTAYSLATLGESDNWKFRPNGSDNFGTGIILWKKSVYDQANQGKEGIPEAAFTYTPFFADAVRGADQGKLQSVSAAWAWSSKTNSYNTTNPAQAIVRSARQLTDFVLFDNNGNGYLSNKDITIEQRMDITYAREKVTFYENGNINTENHIYTSPTLYSIGTSTGGTFRSSLRPGKDESSKDYYVLDGLNNPLVDVATNDQKKQGVHGGTVCNLQITNMRAPYVIGKVQDNKDNFNGSVHDIYIMNSELTDGAFKELQQAKVYSCYIQHTKITNNGFSETIGYGSNISNCIIEDSEIGQNGFAGTIDGDCTIANCSIINATIGANGFVNTMKAGTVSRCKIVNATIGANGFINSIYAGTITGCGIYADKAQYNANQIKHYKPYKSKNGTYDYVAIGIQSDGTRNEQSIAGFVNNTPTTDAWGASIEKCFVAGSLYGAADVSGFTVKIDKGETLNNNYANVVIEAGQEAYGFAQEIVENNAKIQNCHALGVIRKAQNASGFVGSITNGIVSDNYTAFWTVSADTWYPFYKNKTGGNSSNNYYLTECAINTDSGSSNTPNYNTNGVQEKTYQELSALSIFGQTKATSANTKAYYKFMPNDSVHSVYPYPMPADMTAYGDWSYYHLGAASLIYYERIGDQYYLHGVTADANGTEYMTIPDTLLNEAGKTVTEDGYLLILKDIGNEAGSYSISFKNVYGVNASGTYTIGSEDAGKAFAKANDASLTSAIKKALGTKMDCTIYQFGPTYYVKLNKDGFSALDTYAQYSGGVGLTVTQGSNLTAKFSFLPIFADTVTAPTVQNVNGKTEISFASVQKDAAQDGADYIIRSARQLKLLSDWDADSWKNNFDKDLAKRYSYLSSTNIGYKNHLVIRQDMDIQAPVTNRILFGNIDGTYKGQAYTVTGESTAKPVKLSGLKSDFAEKIAPSGRISSLIVDGAAYELDSEDEGRLDKIRASNDLQSESSNNEFVRYNHGTISDVTIQNSDLGTGGLVYQNEYVKPSENAGDDYRSGVIQNCVIRNSDVKGAGLVWKNLGGSITDSSVENCKTGFAGFVQKNVSKALGTDVSGNKIYARAVVDNCSVRNIVAAGNGFAGNNTGVKPMEPFSSTEESCRAEIRNCSVVNGVISGYGFAYENEKNGFIENCQIYGDKSQYEEYLTEAATWTGEQVNRRYYPYTDRTEQKKKAYELVTLTVRTDNFSGAGFAGKNDEKSGITNCSVTGVIDLENKKPRAGFIDDNKGNITGSCNNVIMGSKNNNADGKASGFVNDNEGSISFCHTLGTIEGNSSIAGFSMDNKEGNISCSYSAMWSYKAKKYSLFALDNAVGTFTSCYALSNIDGTEDNGITKVTAETLKSKTEQLSGVTAGTTVKTVAYGQLNTSLNETSEYPFPCGSSITNYGDWKENVNASGNEKTVTLLAGSNAAFAGEAIPALMSEEIADEDILQEEGPREIQAVLGEDETELNLSEFVPQMKGWKLLGWLITSPSELSASEKTTTVSDVVTKINKLSDGDAEASGSSKAVYELETGTKSYHYAPDAVITVTEDMTLSAVWVPDDDTIEKAKDGTLRMDENGNILEDKNEAESTGTTETSEAGTTESATAGTTETTEEGTTESSTAGTTETPEEGTTESSTAGTTETPEAGTTESATTGTTESPEEGTTESSTTGTTEMSETGTTESTELSSSGTETSAENGGGTFYEIYQAEY